MFNAELINVDEVSTQLDNVQKRCRTRTVSVSDIQQVTDRLNNYLDNITSKTDAIGTTVEVDLNAQEFSKAYYKKGFGPESTQFVLELTRKGWKLKEVSRKIVKAKTKGIRIHFTEETIFHMVDHLSNPQHW